MPFLGLFKTMKEAYRQHKMKLAREETPPRYIVEKLTDLVHVPADRLPVCLSEIQTAFETVRDLQSKGVVSGDEMNFVLDSFQWTDDGERTGTINAKNGTIIVNPPVGSPDSIFCNVKNPPRVPGDRPKG